MPSVFAVNVLARYVLTALIQRPDRLIYLSSGMHHGVQPRMDDLLWTKRSWNGSSAYVPTASFATSSSPSRSPDARETSCRTRWRGDRLSKIDPLISNSIGCLLCRRAGGGRCRHRFAQFATKQ